MKGILKKTFFFCLVVLLSAFVLCSCGDRDEGGECSHTFGEWVTVKEATCTEKGEIERYCTSCLEKESRTLGTIAHTPGEIISCKKGQPCSVCGKILRQPSDHQYGEFVINQPFTCTENGEKKQTCTVCGDTVYQTVLATGHKYGDYVTVKEATCAEPGLRERACACGEKISETVVVSHTGEWKITKPQTKAEDGLREIDCSTCHKKITEILPAIGSQGLKYWTNLSNKTCTITGIGTCTDEEVVIPSVIEGCTVNIIAERAFENCQTMVSLSIPSTVTSIGDCIVSGATNLTTLYYNSSCICNISSFMNAPIKKIVFGGSLVSKLTTTVEEVIISENAVSIENNAFSDCYSLKSIVIPNTVTSIGYKAFTNCMNLQEISLPSSVTSIGYQAFEGCMALTDMVIPEGVTELGNMLLFGCESLTSVVIPSTVTKIEGAAFAGCRSLTSITIPGGITEISEGAFEGCAALTSVTVPDGATAIANSAFSYCAALTDIYLPKEITSIGNNAFYNCSALKNINFGGTKSEWESISKGTDWKLLSGLKTVTCIDGTINV